MERSSSEFGAPGAPLDLHDQGLESHSLPNEHSAKTSLGPAEDIIPAFESVIQSDVCLPVYLIMAGY